MNRIQLVASSIALLLLACGSGTTGDNGSMDDAPGSGRAVFNMNCSLCHGRDGKLGLNGAKDLTISALSKNEMVAIVRSGKGAMMPYKDVLTPKEVDAVVEYVRTLGKTR